MAIPIHAMNSPDILRHIFQYLGAWDLWYCGQVSKTWRKVAVGDSLWLTFPGALAVKNGLVGHHGCTLRCCWMRRNWCQLCPVCDVRQASAPGHGSRCDECALDHVRVAVHEARDARFEVEDVRGRRRAVDRIFREYGRTLLAPTKAGSLREDTVGFLLNYMADQYIGDSGDYANSHDRLVRAQARDSVPEDIEMVLRELKWLSACGINFEETYMESWHTCAREQTAPWDVAQQAYVHSRGYVAESVVVMWRRQGKPLLTPLDLDVPDETQLWMCVLDAILEYGAQLNW